MKNLTAILDKANSYAETKKFEPAVLLQARLAPDQLDFTRQVQIACDSAKLGCARATGKVAPENADTEKTIPELKARIESTIKFLETLNAKDFAGAEERRITTPRWEGKTLSGVEYLIHHTIPNFYFHMTTAYSILRHNGVPLGKSDYLGPIPFKA
jgi:uncharacterized protein